jgi:hypothetical protein
MTVFTFERNNNNNILHWKNHSQPTLSNVVSLKLSGSTKPENVKIQTYEKFGEAGITKKRLMQE